MSSSSSRYRIEENRRRRQRQVAASRSEARALEAQLQALRQRAAELAESYGFSRTDVTIGDAGRAPTSDEDVEGHTRHVSRLREILAAGERSLAAAVEKARTAEMLDSLAQSYVPAQTTDTTEAKAAGAARSTAGAEKDSTAVAEREALVERLLGRLDPGVTDERRERARTLAAELVTAASGRADALEDELRLAVQQANVEAHRLDEARARARTLRDSLTGLEGDEVAAMDRRLAEVEVGTTDVSQELEAEVAAVRRRAEAEQDQRYAAETTVQVLERLGYEVEEGFETAFVEDGTVYFQRGNWGDYVVRVRVDADEARLDFDMVRASDDPDDAAATADQSVRDQEMEQTWCDSVPELVGALAEEGVALDIEQRPARKHGLRTISRDLVHLGQGRGDARRREDPHRRGLDG